MLEEQNRNLEIVKVMSFIIEVQQAGVHAKLSKTFKTELNSDQIISHFNEFLKCIDDKKFNVKNNNSIVATKKLLEIQIKRIFVETNSNDIVDFYFPSKSELIDDLGKINLIHKNSNRSSTGQLSLIENFYRNIVYFWIYIASAEGVLQSESNWPPIEIQHLSLIAESGIFKTLNDLEVLAIFCSTKNGLLRAKELNLFTASFEPTLDKIFGKYIDLQSRTTAHYVSSVPYVLREYVVSGHWNRKNIDLRAINEIKKKMTLESHKAQYSLSPLIEILITSGCVHLDNRIIDIDDYQSFVSDNFHADKNYTATVRGRRYKSFYSDVDGNLTKCNFKLGDSYKTTIYGELTYRDLLNENLYFKKRRIQNSAKHRMWGQFASASEDELDQYSFDQLFSYQEDFIQDATKSKSYSTLKPVKRSISDLNEYLCKYLYNFAIDNEYPFLDCSGNNFLDAKLGIAFTDSKLVEMAFEKSLGCKFRPIKFEKWLIKRGLTESSKDERLRLCRDFFSYCERITSQQGIKYVSPFFSKSTSTLKLNFKQTTKEVFGYYEWLLWSELITDSFDALLNLLRSNIFTTDAEISIELLQSSLVTGNNFKFAKHFHGVEVCIDQGMIERTNLQFNYQYQDNFVPQSSRALRPSTFLSCLGAILTMCNAGLRSHGAVNLPADDLIVKRSDIFTAIKVIADKVHVNGFDSHLPTEVLDKLLEFRTMVLKLFPSSFSKKRLIERPGDEGFYVNGLFGSCSNCDEKTVSIVSDYFFYMFNELVNKINCTIGSKMLAEIPLKFMPITEKRGVGVDFRKKVFKEDAFVIPLALAQQISHDSLEKYLSPALLIIRRPNRTPHSFRASLVTHLSLAGTSPQVIKLLTGQAAPTVNHYIKATADNLKLLEMEGVVGLFKIDQISSLIPQSDKTEVEVGRIVEEGVMQSGGMTCFNSGILTNEDLNEIYRHGHRHIAIHSTHLCPFNDECPSYIQTELENKKDCAICPASVSFISDLPAISMKIKFHVEEASHYLDKSKNAKHDYKKKEFQGEWIKHAREASTWMARHHLISSNGKSVAGGKVFKDNKNSLLEYRCEDHEVLGRLLEILETREHYEYQSSELKAAARMFQLKIGDRFGELDKELFAHDPVESVCRTIEKMMRLHQISLVDIEKWLTTPAKEIHLLDSSKLLIERNHA